MLLRDLLFLCALETYDRILIENWGIFLMGVGISFSKPRELPYCLAPYIGSIITIITL